MIFNSWIQILAGIPAILVAITFHEYAHGKTAALLGDPTPATQGRLSLNPLKHLDFMGTLMLVLVGFGWAKPVQVNPFYFRGDRQKGMLYVALAGPLMNLVLAYLSAVALRLFGHTHVFLYFFLSFLMWYNTMLAIFNLIPLPPLDGSKILAGLLPLNKSNFFYQLEAYGPLILLLLLATGILGDIIRPIIYGVLDLIQIAASWGIF